MGLKDRAKQMATSAASVALATTGLSSCNDNGAVDPPPPPFQCTEVNTGQALAPSATINADTITVAIRNQRPELDWRVTSIRDVTGATMLSASLPVFGQVDPTLVLRLRLQTPGTTQVSFLIDSQFMSQGVRCSFQRTYVLNISSGGVQISQLNPTDLPLAARQSAQIVVVRQASGVVELEARTAYDGQTDISWNVSAGELNSPAQREVSWTLPAAPGIYQAELVLDFGNDGLAYDMLLLEVR